MKGMYRDLPRSIDDASKNPVPVLQRCTQSHQVVATVRLRRALNVDVETMAVTNYVPFIKRWKIDMSLLERVKLKEETNDLMDVD